ncbi:MAG: lysophospholipase [Candidatus Eremiobacteraeota bacterium]|nr:lysophospholipase [Candidatus Eremiobacteraeota bacterium]
MMVVRVRDLSHVRIDRVSFPSAGGTVRGLFYHSGAPATCVVLCHGYSSSKHNVDSLAFHLAADGFCALAFDFLGHKLGASEGTLARADDLVANALAGISWAARRSEVSRVIVGGHSMGAATAIGAALESPVVDGVIAMATALNRNRSFAEQPMLSGLANRTEYVDGPSADDITRAMDRLSARIGEIAPRPVLIIAGKRDSLVAPSSVQQLFDAAREPKAFELIDATHTDCAERARFAVVKWLRARGFGKAPLNG